MRIPLPRTPCLLLALLIFLPTLMVFAEGPKEEHSRELQDYHSGIVYHDIVILTVSQKPHSNMGSHSTPKDTLKDLRKDTPKDTPKETGSIKPNEERQIRIRSMGKIFSLQVRPSPVTASTTITSQSELTLLSSLEILTGTVEGDGDSWVRLAIDNGVMTGFLKTEGTLYEIAVAGNHKLLNRTSTVLFEPRFKNLVKATTESESGGDPLLFANLPDGWQTNLDTPYPKILSPNQGVVRTLRIGVVVDSRFNEYHSNHGLARALSIINFVDGLYQEQLGVAVQLDQIIIYDNPHTDPMRNVTGTIEEILTSFRNVRINEESLNADLTLVHFLTGLRDQDNIIGLGWIDTACRRDGYDVSMSTPFAFDGLLAAHEIAHNLGALHDDDPNCFAASNDVMWPQLSTQTSSNFSHCSRGAMASGVASSCNLDNLDLAIELESVPTGQMLQHLLMVSVTNRDATRSATSVMSTTTLPEGATLSFDEGACSFEDGSLTCQHGTILAGQSHQVRMTIEYPGDSDYRLISQIITTTFSDIELHNNRITILVNPDRAESDGSLASVPQPSDDALLASGGSGTVFVLLPCLGFVFFRRHYLSLALTFPTV